MDRGALLGFALFFASASALALPQASAPASAPSIEHDPAPCMDTEVFPLIEARLSSPAEGGAARLAVRFKSDEGTDWYEILLEPEGGGSFEAALPKPLPEAGRVVYYITSTRPELRSEQYVVNVLSGGCPGGRSAGAEASDGIHVRRTSSDQAPVPVGFSPDGIRGGGRSSRATLGIVAGAAGGAGVAALLLTNDQPVPENPDMGGNPEALRACFTPDPIPDIDSGDTVLFDADCTTPSSVTAYQWNFGDGTTGQGSSVEHRFIPGGIYTVTLTVSDGQRTDSTSRLVRALATPVACFITTPDPPRIRTNESISFNAECSVGDRDGGPVRIASYFWDFGDGDDGGDGRFVSHLFTKPDLYGVTLTVTNADGRQDKTTQFVVVERRASGNRQGVAFTSALELPGGVRALLSLNDSETVAAIAPSPQLVRVRARAGENVLEGRLLSEASEPGRWRIDFRGTPGFVAGSLRVDSGQLLTMDSHSLVFQLTGKPEAPIRIRFRLEE